MGIKQLDRIALADSVIEQSELNGQSGIFAGYSYRGTLLPSYGSRTRELTLRQYWHHDYNLIFRSAINGLIKRVQSTPYEVVAPKEDGSRWQELLMGADFGDWDRFLSKAILDYSRHDQGAFIELIAPGNPLDPIATPIVGMAVLDSIRCYPTMNVEYPVVYYSIHGKMHLLHQSRVVQLVDSADSEENHRGYGDSALSRAISAVKRQILMGRYVEQFLDDKPRPGILTFGNISQNQVEAALEGMLRANDTDGGGDWGRTVRLYGLTAENKPTVDNYSFASAPEKFDFEKYTEQDVKEIALAIGLDIQDIWQLSSSTMGSAAQSEILAQKSRGRGLGRILKALERLINQALPEDVEFKWKYKDGQQDQEQANQAQAAASTLATLTGILSIDEQRQYLANTVEAFADVLLDENGEISRLNDDDPKAEEQATLDDTATAASPETQPAETTASIASKEFGATASEFATSVREFMTAHNNKGEKKPILRAIFLNMLYDAGRKAFYDGLRDAGDNPDQASFEEQARYRRGIVEWFSAQGKYTDGLINDLASGSLSANQIPMRSDFWVNKSLRDVYYKGMEAVSNNAVYAWVLGNTKEHCATCLANSRQKHTMKEWRAAGMFPGSHDLECKGYNCKCKFGAPEKGRSVGTLATAKPSGLIARLRNWLAGFFKR